MEEILECLREQCEMGIMIENNIRDVVRGHIVASHESHTKDFRFDDIHYEATERF